ncbi:MAG TPA: ABC transporter permease [Pseudogracilibacillus sp.]|nr:ABC transporter permease [Pseudogracilibacillus sp.]
MTSITETKETENEVFRKRFDIADVGPLIGLILLVIIGSIVAPSFWTKGNIINVLNQVSILGLGALGMTFVIISRYFDLSIAGFLSLSGVLVVGMQETLGTFGSIIFMILIAVIAGMFNGTIMRVVKGDFGASIMITFGTGTIFSAIALLYSKGYTLVPIQDPLFDWFGNGRIFTIPVPIIIFLVSAVIMHILLRYTTFGRSVYLTGANPEAARLSGIPIHRVQTTAFVILAVLVAIGALIRSSQTLGATATAGEGYELDVIAAVAIGGTSLAGGAGNIVRTLVGVLIIGVLNNLFILIGLSNFDQMVAKGVIIIIALLLDKRPDVRSWIRRLRGRG